MKNSAIRSDYESTSAEGTMRPQKKQSPFLVCVMPTGIGTSSASALPADLVARSVRPEQRTTTGTALVQLERIGAAIAELRRLSGLTWDQLAQLFKVSRRSLHFWASGKTMTPANEEHLQRLLAAIRQIDRGSASANRAELLAVRDDDIIPLDLLAAGQYDRVVGLVGGGHTLKRVMPGKLSEEAMAARMPRPPEELVDALQDRVHRESGIVRAAKSTRVKGGD